MKRISYLSAVLVVSALSPGSQDAVIFRRSLRHTGVYSAPGLAKYDGRKSNPYCRTKRDNHKRWSPNLCHYVSTFWNLSKSPE